MIIVAVTLASLEDLMDGHAVSGDPAWLATAAAGGALLVKLAWRRRAIL